VHVVVIPSEDRNRLSLLDWTGALQRPVPCGERVWRQANASSRLTRFWCPPVLVLAALTGAPFRQCHAVTLYGGQQGSLHSIQAISSDYCPAAPRRVRTVNDAEMAVWCWP
jgi:hypothetical protein